MKIIFKLTLFLIFLSSCSNKLKIYSAHALKEEIKRKKNFYLKDKNRSYEFLKGTWLWTIDSDSLVVKITPHYKKPYDSKIFNYDNAFYDSSIFNIKYIKDGNVIYNDFGEEILESCLYAANFELYTHQFFLRNRCDSSFNGAFLIFMNDFNSLSMLGRGIDKNVLLKKEGEYEVIVPNSIILEKVIE